MIIIYWLKIYILQFVMRKFGLLQCGNISRLMIEIKIISGKKKNISINLWSVLAYLQQYYLKNQTVLLGI